MEPMSQNQTGLWYVSRILLILTWIVASSGLIAGRLYENSAAGSIGGFAAVLYIFVLIWHLALNRPLAADLPDFQSTFLPRLGFKSSLALILVVLLFSFLLGIIIHPQLVILFGMVVIALALIWKRRAQTSKSMVGGGLAACAIIFLAQTGMGKFDPYTIYYFLTIPILFIAGCILLDQTQFSHVHIVENRYGLAVRSFLWACVLALPPALMNVSGGASAQDTWVDQWWKPVAALVPGIAEETWARLFLMTLIYALLRPKISQHPRRAFWAAILIAAFTHGLAHLPTMAIPSQAGLGMIVASLLYGVPMGLMFSKFDFESAVGYHFFVDFVRFMAAFLM